MKKIRTLAQVVGFVTLGLLALYGLLTLLGGAGPSGLVVRADAETPNTPDEAAAALGSTIPQTMNYQGFVRNPDGSLATGTYKITARIYGQAAGGTELYETAIPNVSVRDGLFNIVLGDHPVLTPAAFSDAPRYIGISLNDEPELIPRQRLHAVPWALTASTLVDGAPVQSVQGLSSSGDVTVDGNTSVTGNITVTGNTSVAGDIKFGGTLDGLGVETYSLDNLNDCGVTKEKEMTDIHTSFCALGRYQIHDIASAGDDNDMAECNIDWDSGKWKLTARVDCKEGGQNPDVYCQAFCLTNIKWYPPPP